MKTTSYITSARSLFAFCFFGAVLLCACTLGNPDSYTNRKSSFIRRDGTLDFVRMDGSVAASIDIEIADTPETRTQGLMGQTSLKYTEGMLFIFEYQKPHNFWMKNTPISLDIIFLDQDGCVVNIAESTTPMSDTIYSPEAPIKYAAEVSAGFAKHFKIEKGICIKWQRL